MRITILKVSLPIMMLMMFQSGEGMRLSRYIASTIPAPTVVRVEEPKDDLGNENAREGVPMNAIALARENSENSRSDQESSSSSSEDESTQESYSSSSEDESTGEEISIDNEVRSEAELLQDAETALIEGLNNRKSIAELRNIAKRSRVVNNATLREDMRLIEAISGDTLGTLNAEIPELRDIKTRVENKLRNLRENDVNRDFIERLDADIFRAGAIINRFNAQLNQWREILDAQFNGNQQIHDILSAKFQAREASIRNLTQEGQFAENLQTRAQPAFQIWERKQVAEYYNSLTLEDAARFSAEDAKDAIEYGFIDANYFVKEFVEYEAKEAVRSIVTKVREERGNSNAQTYLNRGQYVSTLRVLITQNGELFKNADFVRELKTSFNELRKDYNDDGVFDKTDDHAKKCRIMLKIIEKL